MHPGIEDFLEDAFASVKPHPGKARRVVVEPDYNTDPDPNDAAALSQELERFLWSLSPDAAALASPQGFTAEVPPEYPLLLKYVRAVTLHADPVEEGSWIEVEPPGNWI